MAAALSVRRRIAATAIAALSLSLVDLPAADATPVDTNTSAGTPVLGDYATPLVGAPDANGVRHIDAGATVARLSAAHVDTYAYLIYFSALYGTGTEAQMTQAQWNDLPGFASAAAAADIDVLVYLVPPSESVETGYKPYGWDYKAWATAIATKALAHRNIRGIVLDDFAENTAEGGSTKPFKFTASYVQQMMASARLLASWLTFRAIIYYPNTVSAVAVLPAYRTVVDGIIFPYRAGPTGRYNTTDASAATTQGNTVSAMSKCHSGNHCAQIQWPRRTPSVGGNWGAVSQTIFVGSGATKTLTFWQDDDYNGLTAKYHYLQAVIDGVVVWESDVSAPSNGLWHKVSVNVTSRLAGKTTATLTLRVRDSHSVTDFHTAGWFDDVAGSGFTVSDGGFENGSFAPWTVSTNTSHFAVALAPTLNVDFMTYTTKFAAETAPTSASYVQSVLGQALSMVDAGTIDGSIAYALNLTGLADGRSDPAVYGVVQSLYGGF